MGNPDSEYLCSLSTKTVRKLGVIDLHKCMSRWLVSSGIHTNTRIQGVPAEYRTVARWTVSGWAGMYLKLWTKSNGVVTVPWLPRCSDTARRNPVKLPRKRLTFCYSFMENKTQLNYVSCIRVELYTRKISNSTDFLLALLVGLSPAPQRLLVSSAPSSMT